MAAHQLHSRNAAAYFLIGIVVAFVSEMGQSTKNDCPNGCNPPTMDKRVTFVITKNVSEGFYDSSSCFPIATELLFLCNEHKNYQFDPTLTKKHLIRTCTGNGWYNGFDQPQPSPKTVERKLHCSSPITQHSQNISIEIQGRNINIDDNNMTSLFYSVGTIATYKCKDPKPNRARGPNRPVSHTDLRCTKSSKNFGLQNKYSWEWINGIELDLDRVCDSSKEVLADEKENGVSEPQQIPPHISENPISINEHQKEFSLRPQPPPNNMSLTVRNVLIGICSFLGFILLVVLFGALHHNKVRLYKRYNDNPDRARKSSNSMPGDNSKLKKHFDDREQSLQYINIIPIKVNQETVYTEVETGKIAGKSAPTAKHKIEDDQVHSTVYAEIHHSTIPKD